MNLLLLALVVLFGVAVFGVTSYAVYYVATHQRREPAGPTGHRPPTPPPPTPGSGETKNIYFYNNRATDTIWVVPTFGGAIDTHNPRWTNWPLVGVPADHTYVVPHTDSMVPIKLAPGETGTMLIYTSGMASVNFTVMVDCVEPSMICKIGDSVLLPGHDISERGDVPLKPAIDTRIELTFGCNYADTRLCGINPSCITDAVNCPGMVNFMADHPGAVWHTDGLLYDSSGVNIPVPASGGGWAGSLSDRTFMNLSCVEGYTVPVELKIRRPSTAGASTVTRCYTDAGNVDLSSDTDWQTVGDTRHLKLSACPTDELVWPSRKTVIALSGQTTDGYNSSLGQLQFDMPWLTLGNDPSGTPTSTPPVKLTAGFVHGTTIDLTYYRDPKEVIFNPSWSVNDRIGCAGICAALTKPGSVSMMYPQVGGHVFTTPSYIVDPTTRLLPDDRGVSDICGASHGVGSIATDSNGITNTSAYWPNNPGVVGPASTTDTVINYAFGFFANVYAPNSDSPWFVAGSPPTSRNPYVGGPETSKYVGVVRNGGTPQGQTTRAYSYSNDDAYNVINCTATSDPQNLVTTPDSRGQYYANYEVLVVIHDEAP